ncbi:MAG: tripartite tricarboxylate transporter substrate binding protein [Betaproteobacteria bacterium]|jgi:tripartite-type tricarboxylate transporter receptor subunit TctC
MMKFKTPKGGLLAVLIGTTILMCNVVFASDYPNKPIKVIVPSPPAGPPDLILRILGPKLSASLGQPIVIENKPGAGGMVGTAYLSQQSPDGYSWLFTTASHVNIPPFNENVNYDPVKDFTHVTLVAQNFGQVLVVRPDLGVNNLEQLIQFAKKNPGKLTYGHAGLGTASHIPAELLKSMTGTDILAVPFKGVAEATNDVIAGRVDIFFVGTQIALQHVQAGKLKAIAITGGKRWDGMPTVPTMNEAGLKGFEVVNWFGLWLPIKASPEIVNKIYSEVKVALQSPDIKQQFAQLGLEGVGMKPEDFVKYVTKEALSAKEIAHKIPKE